MTSFLFGLRLGRWGLAGFSLGALVLNYVQAVGFYQVAGRTTAQRDAFGASMSQLAAQFVALLPPPVRPETVEGYIQFRGFGPLAVLVAIWALASATGFARGDEERGITAMELATGTARPVVVAAHAAAFAVAAGVASAAAGAGFVFGVLYGRDFTGPPGLVAACALLAALGAACYGLSLLAAQLVTSRAATAVAGALLLALYLVNSLSRVFSWLSGWRWLSPFHYYELSQPLPPGSSFDPRGLIVLCGAAFLATVAAAALFTRRDVGAALLPIPAMPRRASVAPAHNPMLVLPVLRGLYERRLGLLAWCAGMALIAIVFVALSHTIVQALLTIPSLLPYLSIFVHQQLYPAVLGYTWLDVAALLFAGLAITYVASWSSEDANGRLEALLSAPESRAALVVERVAVLTVAAGLIAGVSGAALFYSSHNAGIDLDVGRLCAACILLVLFVLVFAGAGSLLTAWNPRAAVALLAVFAFASYLDDELGAIYRLPGWVQNLSAFRLLGTPLLHGVDGRNVALMILLALAGVGASILAMQRRDVGA